MKIMLLNIDLPLAVFDLAAFNDIPTGYTPTTTKDGSFRDFSKLENLDTPTPLGNPEGESYFIYPPERRRTEDDIADPKCSCVNYNYPIEYKSEPTDWMYNSDASTTGYQFAYPTETNRSSFLDKSKYNTCTINTTAPSTLCLSDSSTQSNLQTTLDGSAFSNYSDIVYFNEYYAAATERNQPAAVPLAKIEPALNKQQIYRPISHETNNPDLREPDRRSLSNSKPFLTDSTDLFNQFGVQSQSSFNVTAYSSQKMECHPTSTPMTSKPKKSPTEKAFPCHYDGCVKQFARVDELRRHQRTHSDIRHFVCEVCSKGFTRSDHLMTHRRTHTGERPYPCDFCERRFARSDERNRHIKVHFRNKVRAGRKASKQPDEPMSHVQEQPEPFVRSAFQHTFPY